MYELALFAGAGGGILGGKLLGWRTVCAVEIDEYARRVLMARQDDGCLEPFPIWDDIRTFDGKPWRGLVDIVTGGFPCQDISAAGKGAGIEGERSGLWGEMARIIGEVLPPFVFVENSPLLVGRGLAVVLGDLAKMGYDARWGVFSACSLGAPHSRERLFCVGYATGNGRHESSELPSANLSECIEQSRGPWSAFRPVSCHGLRDQVWCVPYADAVGSADGMAHWLDRLKCSGNGQVPAVVRLAWRLLAPKE